MLLAVVLGAAVVLDAPPPRAEFVFINPSDVFTLDPQRMSYQQDVRMARALYETLAVFDPEGRTIPGAADSWTSADGGRRWEFHLRPDGRWSNGDPVVSEDFRRGWMRLLLPDVAGDYTGFLFSVKGGEAFFKWRDQALRDYAALPAAEQTQAAAEALWRRTQEEFDRTVAIRAPARDTLVVELEQPVPYWLEACGFPALGPVHRPTLDRFSRLEPDSGRLVTSPGWLKGGALVGNGPYQLDHWRYKRSLRMSRNPHYRASNAASCATIDAIPIENPATALLAIESGAADWLPDLLVDYRADLVEEARAGRRPDVHAVPSFGTDFFSYNCRPTLPGVPPRPNPFADPRIRRAFTMAADKATITESVTRLREPVSNVLVPPGTIAGYRSPRGLDFDPAAAAALLREAGWEDRDGDGWVENERGEPFPTVDVLYSTGSPRYQDLAMALRGMWQRHLGVHVELRPKEGKLYKEDLRSGNFMVARGGWYGDYPDPMTYLESSRTGDGNNDRGYSNPEFDALLAQAAREPDPAARLEILSRAESILVDRDLPMLPLCTYLTITMYHPARVEGITSHPRLEQYLGRVKVKPGAESRP